MKLSQLLRFICISLLALSVAACGDDGGDDTDTGTDTGGDGDGDQEPATGDATQFVVASVGLPEAGGPDYALDLDGDPEGSPENSLGAILSALNAGGDLGLQDSVNSSVNSGAILLLLELTTEDFTSHPTAGLKFLLGDPTDITPSPCADEADEECAKHLAGTGSFAVDASSPSDAELLGPVAGGLFTGGPGEVTIQIDLSDAPNTPPITIELIGARVEVEVAADGLMSGVIGGGIPKDQLTTSIIPGIADVVVATFNEANCALDDSDPPECACEDSTGDTLAGLFDADEDCVITSAEVENNNLIMGVLREDIDLLDDNGEFNPRQDGVNDSLSVGLGFTAVNGSF